MGVETVKKYFEGLTENQIKQFEALGPLYEEWNSKINVISRKDIDQLYEHHILHSLFIAKIISFKPGTKILDVGTGGGFPGIPLAILFPECSFHLVDSVGKKIRVVQEISSSIGLTNLTSEKARVETLSGRYDFIVSRAVTTLGEFVKWVKPLIKPYSQNELKNGILYLKGGDLKSELRRRKMKTTVYNISDYFNEDFFETKKLIHLY